mgnify:FL=1
MSEWPVAAIKSYVGHSLAAAAGDQLTATLGIWQHGVIPRINTIDALADDVATKSLGFAMQERDGSDRDYALINSKGFGGNNATAALLSPTTTEGLLRQHHGEKALRAWRDRCEATLEAQSTLELKRLAGEWSPTYRFDEGVVDDKAVSVSDTAIELGDKLITLRSRAPETWRLD